MPRYPLRLGPACPPPLLLLEPSTIGAGAYGSPFPMGLVVAESSDSVEC